MSRRMTVFLGGVALLLGLLVWASDRYSAGAPRPFTHPGRPAVIALGDAEVQQIRLLQDYWNSVLLERTLEGAWRIAEPFEGPVETDAVMGLLQNLVHLPVVDTIDLPGNDTARHREYGLWEPVLQVVLETDAGRHVFLFGAKTPAEDGVYCALAERDGVFVVPADVLAGLKATAEAFGKRPTPSALR